MEYPEDFINQIICGNNLKVMKDIPGNYIDLTVTSPPYDNLRTYKGYNFNFEGTAKELYRITKQGGVVVWVVGDATIKGSETGTSFKQALYFKEIEFDLHDTMIYQKTNFSNPSMNRYHQVFEYMFVFSKGKPKTFNPINDRKNKCSGETNWGRNTGRQKDGAMKERIKRINTIYGMRHNVWLMKTVSQERPCKANKHPATFPEKLAQDHIISWSNKGDIVLDPMCGSGTTCKMAKILSRKYIGIDVSKEYCEIARNRIKSIPESLF